MGIALLRRKMVQGRCPSVLRHPFSKLDTGISGREYTSLGHASFTCQHSKRRWSFFALAHQRLSSLSIQQFSGNLEKGVHLVASKSTPPGDEGPSLFLEPFGHVQYIFGTRSVSNFESKTHPVESSLEASAILRPFSRPGA